MQFIVTDQWTGLTLCTKRLPFIKVAMFNSLFLFSDIVTVLLDEPDAPVLVEVTR